jgi:hypothetical protein
MALNPVEVLAGVPVEMAGRATALLRDAGIPVCVRDVVAGRLPGSWVHVAAADAGLARELLAARRFPVPMILADRLKADERASEGSPGDDVWSLLVQEDSSGQVACLAP